MPPDFPPRNPYIAGKALGDERSFFGREDIFRLVETVLSSADQNALVLFGQRRIGKTSILLQLRRCLPSSSFGPIYFDLMDRTRKPFSIVLYELAATMATEFNLPQPQVADFSQGDHFRESFLPSLYRSLDKNTRPVLLFDEFDVLDVAAEEQLPATAAARAFFPYLRRLMEGEPLLAFVFVVGRKAEDLSIDIKATFKAARYQRISVLDEESARSLVRLAEGEGSLRFTTAAIDRLLSLTARHPYLTQLMCQLLFDVAYAASPLDPPTVDVSDVEAIIPKVLEAGENVFEWIWDGLPPAERVIFSAVAGATGENAVITEDELMSILQRHGIRILIRELELAPKTLIEWEMLRLANGGYGFFIELMRRWVVERKALPKVKDELDRVNPIADRHYQLGNDYYRLGNLPEAIDQLQAALRANPNHLKARLLVGETLREEGAIDEAVKELEEAYRYDEDAARYPLVRALLAQGENAERTGYEDTTLNIYQRVLAISPREAVARDKVARIHSIRRKRALEATAAEVETLLQGAEWDKAAEVYGRLVELDPEDQRWSEGLKQAERELNLSRLYAGGLGAMQQSKWAEAQRAFADVVYERPTYKEAAAFLASAARQETRPSASKLLPHLFQLVVALVLGATLSAAAFALYLPVVDSGFRAKESTLTIASAQQQAELEQTKQQLAQIQSDRDTQRETSEKLLRAIEEMSKQIGEKDNRIAEISKKLDEERDTYKKQGGSNQNQLERTRDDLTAVKKKLKETEQELAAARQELKATKASLEASREAKGRPKSAGEPKPPSEAETGPTDKAPAGGETPKP